MESKNYTDLNSYSSPILGASTSNYITRNTNIYEQSINKYPFTIPNNIIPLEIGQFLWNFVTRILTQDYDGLKRLYELEFNNLAEQYYPTRPWPNVNTVQEFYQTNECFHELIAALYIELTFRHLFARCKDSLSFEERKESWKNYTDLFNYFHDEECFNKGSPNKNLLLPEQWYWDIHDELVYQFQDTCRWKSSFAKNLPESKTEQSAILDILKANQEMWSAAHVFQFLHQIIISSEVKDYLNKIKTDSSFASQATMDVPTMLGYFSLISLMRLYTITGEYSLALEVVKDLEISARNYYCTIPSCHASFIYHLTFSYIMLRRYSDASRILCQYLLFTGRNRSQSHSTSRHAGFISKLIDKMYMLLIVCDLLSPSRLDEYLIQTLKEKYSDKYNKLTLENIDLVNEIITFAQPKLINPAFSRYETKEDLLLYYELEKEKNEYPFQAILKEMHLQRRTNEIFSYASFYHNIQLSKLASLMDMKDKNATESIRDELLSIKQKSCQLIWKNGSLVSGEYSPSKNKFEFYLDGDVMHIKTQKTQKSLADHFMKSLNRSQDLLSKIYQPTHPSSSADNTK